MDKCIHIKGVIDGKTVSELEWKEKSNKHKKAVDYWFKNIDAAVMYDIKEPDRLTEFKFCPFCGVKF